MKTMTVKDVMIPISEYTTISQESNLCEAVTALTKAQEDFDPDRGVCLHRALLVSGESNKIVGKLSQLDVLKALEPQYKKILKSSAVSRFGYSDKFIQSSMEQFALWSRPLEQICGDAGQLKVKDFMYTPVEGEYVKENVSLDEALHALVMGHHHSLLVTRDEEIVGILRLSNVFKQIDNMIKHCQDRSLAA